MFRAVSSPRARHAELSGEKGFGLIELLFAMLMLNIGIMALVGAFNSGAVALASSATTSNAAVVADEAMQVYRELENKAIYLAAPAGGGSDSGVPPLPNGIPSATSSWYAQYMTGTAANTAGYSSTLGSLVFSYTTPPPQWVTPATGTTYAPIPATDITKLPSPTPSPDPTKAVQLVAGPDGQNYTVFQYVMQTRPNGAGGYVKQVTIIVYDPRKPTRIVAQASALFDPNVAP